VKVDGQVECSTENYSGSVGADLLVKRYRSAGLTRPIVRLVGLTFPGADRCWFGIGVASTSGTLRGTLEVVRR
jgi:hypothetical protein